VGDFEVEEGFDKANAMICMRAGGTEVETVGSVLSCPMTGVFFFW